MLPPTPHSAPANIAFNTLSTLPSPSPGLDPVSSASVAGGGGHHGSGAGGNGRELDFDISPLTSPWLEPYGSSGTSNNPAGAGNAITGPAIGTRANKRRNVSSSGDEREVMGNDQVGSASITGVKTTTASGRPARKRQSPSASSSMGTTAAGGTGGKRRGTRSANSTPLFVAQFSPISSSGSGQGGPGAGMRGGVGGSGGTEDVLMPDNTPSPVDPPMPPPAHPLVHPASAASVSMSASGSPTASSGQLGGSSAGAGKTGTILPVTPASIMKLNRTTWENGGSASAGGAGNGGKEGRAKRRGSTATNSNAVGVSPGLKPIRPGKYSLFFISEMDQLTYALNFL